MIQGCTQSNRRREDLLLLLVWNDRPNNIKIFPPTQKRGVIFGDRPRARTVLRQICQPTYVWFGVHRWFILAM